MAEQKILVDKSALRTALPKALDEIKPLKQWVCYRLEQDEKNPQRMKKMPKNPMTGTNASSDKPETWGMYSTAVECLSHHKDFDGLGFEFAFGYAGIDIDHCIDQGVLEPFAADIVQQMDSYTEVSPSGNGIHILFKTMKPIFGDRRKNDSIGLEIYTYCRYFTVTGNVYGEEKPIQERTKQAQAVYDKHIKPLEKPKKEGQEGQGTPPTVENHSNLPCDDLWQKMFDSKSGKEIRALFDGDLGGHNNNHSGADQALVNYLAFWTGHDPRKMDEMFRQSRLMRDKWDERRGTKTYGEMTIEKALADVTESYNPQEGCYDWDGTIISDGNRDSPPNKPKADSTTLAYSDSFVSFVSFDTKEEKKNIPDFDLDILPRSVRDFAEATAESLQVAPGMVAPAILGVGALAIQKKYSINPKPGYFESGNLYVVIAAEASERKSPTMAEIMKPVYEFEQEENDRRAPDIKRYQTQKKIIEGQIKNYTEAATNIKPKKGEESKGNGFYLDKIADLEEELEALEEVAPIRLVADDITVEKMAVLMSQNNERLGIVSTEGGIFSILSGTYNDKTVIDLVLKSYTGDRFSQDRVQRNGCVLYHPLMSMILYAQPIVVGEVMANPEFVERGLTTRFLYSFPTSSIGARRWQTGAIRESIKEAYYSTVKSLLSVPVTEKPEVIGLDSKASDLAEQFFYELENEMVICEPEFKAWMGKLHGTTMRIALVLHCFKYAESNPAAHTVDVETMGKAIQAGRYFKEHASYAYEISGLTETQEVRNAKYILRRIESTGKCEIPVREVQRLCQNDGKGLKTKDDLILPLNTLVEHGYIRIQKSSLSDRTDKTDKNSKGGRPTEVVYVNPEYLAWKKKPHYDTGTFTPVDSEEIPFD